MLTEAQQTKIQQLLLNEDTFATSLLAICIDNYGTDIFEWEPETLWNYLFEDFNVILPAINKDKLQALIVCYTTNLFYHSWEMFSHICNVLNGAEASFTTLDPVTAEEALWGIYEVAINTQDGDSDEFSDEIQRYLGIVLKHDGITNPPDALRVAITDDNPGIQQWADDPELFSAIRYKTDADSYDLKAYLYSQLKALLAELNEVPLNHRNDKSWEKYVTAVIKSIPDLGEKLSPDSDLSVP